MYNRTFKIIFGPYHPWNRLKMRQEKTDSPSTKILSTHKLEKENDLRFYKNEIQFSNSTLTSLQPPQGSHCQSL
ncbi:hypothetical protein EUGRSUZ_G00389 [Eucalyptus grandis]|uniref:Uncharacterized protein n=2 Tax=Eucalyptus grandis TaxID=71139 RepID=A0ACC3K0E7_EUCGR|nr:hypothetical protein EUGRSUZ_G00389 [Eucalyptus grandis]